MLHCLTDAHFSQVEDLTHIFLYVCMSVFAFASYRITLYCNIATIVSSCIYGVYVCLFFSWNFHDTICCWAEEVCERAPLSYWDKLKEVVLVADGNVEWALWKLLIPLRLAWAFLSWRWAPALWLWPRVIRPSCIRPQEPTGPLPSNVHVLIQIKQMIACLHMRWAKATFTLCHILRMRFIWRINGCLGPSSPAHTGGEYHACLGFVTSRLWHFVSQDKDGGSLLGFLGVIHFKGRWKTAVDEKIVQKIVWCTLDENAKLFEYQFTHLNISQRSDQHGTNSERTPKLMAEAKPG